MDSTEMAPPAGPMSMGSRLINVFAAPGELFTSVAASRFTVANWLVPAVLVGLIGLVVSVIIFSQPAMAQEIAKMQDVALQKQIESGKISEEQAEQARNAMRGIGMVIAKVAAAVGSVVGGVVSPLWWGFLAWLVVRIVLRTPLPFMRAVEVAGLSSLIGGLGMIVGMFLSMGMGRLFAGPHLGFFVTEFDMTHRGHLALAAVNVFGLWQLGILALGISKLISRPFMSVGLLLFGVWAGYKAIAVGLGLAQFVF